MAADPIKFQAGELVAIEVIEDLTPVETATLAACEKTITAGLETFIDVGRALATIGQERLYRARYATFEEYCSDKWGFTRQHAGRLVRAAHVVAALESGPREMEPIGSISAPIADSAPSPILPSTETQARELAPLLDEPEKLKQVWDKAVEDTNGKPTQAAIRKVRREMEDDDHVTTKAPRGPHRKPLPDAARSVGIDTRKLAERLRRIADDDRLSRNRDQVEAHIGFHLVSMIEVCQDLLSRINDKENAQ